MTSLCLAHLSDLHFGVPNYSFTQFLSKRWIGNLNFLLFRRKAFQSNHLCFLPELFDQLAVERICFTGDFTTTSSPEEFQLAKKFLNLFSQSTFTLPGNHDMYTKESENKLLFYNYFPSLKGELDYNFSNDRIYCTPIKKGWYWIGLDCSAATPPFQAYGIFTERMGEKLRDLLNHIPDTDKVIVGNHFPLFSSKNPQHDLKNGKLLQSILKEHYPKVKLYLHGHIHKPYIINKMHEGYPLVLNSGSSAIIENGGFYLINIKRNQCIVEHFFYDPTKKWFSKQNHEYIF